MTYNMYKARIVLHIVDMNMRLYPLFYGRIITTEELPQVLDEVRLSMRFMHDGIPARSTLDVSFWTAEVLRFYSVVVDSVLLGNDAASLGSRFPTFRRILVPSSSRVQRSTCI